MKVYDFKNPEDFAELEKQAYCGTIDYSMFPPAAYRYFDKLTKLYESFKSGKISSEGAKQLKLRYLSEYNVAVQDYEKWCEVWKSFQENIKLAGTGLADIEKSKSVYDIAVNAISVIGKMTNDKSFADRQMKKIRKED